MVTGDCIHSSRGTQRQFPPYTLKTLFRLSRVLLEMHSKWRYKIGICSATEGKLESLRNYKRFNFIIPKILGAI